MEQTLNKQEFAKQKLANIPIWTTCIGAITLALFAIPGLTQIFEFNRIAIAQGGEWMRFLTAHMTHWSWEHLVWDLLVFLIFGALCESRAPRRFLLCLGASALAISTGVALAHPEWNSYRGLSGIDSALFGLAAVLFLRDRIQDRDWLATAAIAILLVGFFTKIGYETATSAPVFVKDNALFTPDPLSHLIGFSVGIISGWLGRELPQSGKKSSSKKIGRLNPA